MLATPAGPEGLPAGGDWAYEVKWDGIRVLVEARDGRLTVRSRTGRDVTPAFPELAALAAVLPDVLLDGEAVALDAGRPSFSRVVERVHVTDPRRAAQLARDCPVTLFLFDLLRLDGRDLTQHPWSQRREALERLLAATGGDETRRKLSPVYDDGAALLAATEANGLEGVVAKRRTSRYLPGHRSPDWVKHAHRSSLTCLVGGWRPETGDPRRVGALLVGVRAGQGLRFLGRVGSGMTAERDRELRARLAPLEIPGPPFDEALPRVDAAGARWCRPELAVEVRYLGHGLPPPGSRLRAPVLRGIRPVEDVLEDDAVEGVAEEER
ncbi:MAG: non-homologous end-joining DNA ligase [Kineosporiaceae bacterium]